MYHASRAPCSTCTTHHLHHASPRYYAPPAPCVTCTTRRLYHASSEPCVTQVPRATCTTRHLNHAPPAVHHASTAPRAACITLHLYHALPAPRVICTTRLFEDRLSHTGPSSRLQVIVFVCLRCDAAVSYQKYGAQLDVHGGPTVKDSVG